jgi:hypothetical protein
MDRFSSDRVSFLRLMTATDSFTTLQMTSCGLEESEMSFTPDFEEALQSLSAFVIAPLVLVTAEAVRQPAIQSVICEGYVLSERMTEAIAEIQETLDDLAARAQAKLKSEPQQIANDFQHPSSIQPQSDIAEAINRLLFTLNRQTHRLSNGAVDLRLLLPAAFAALAIRQLVDKGLELDKIPWYNLAWYAFDSFAKMNADGNQSTADALLDLSNRIEELSNG